MSEELISRLQQAIISMDSDIAVELAKEIVQSGVRPSLVVEGCLVKAMKMVADSYDRKEIFLPQVLASVNAYYAAFDVLRPWLPRIDARAGRSVLIGVVEGDIHDIGKNLVRVMMEAYGYECYDLGRDVPTEVFLENISKHDPPFIALSTLMTPTMRGMKDIVDGMVDADIRKGKLVIIGGGPVDKAFAERIGADHYGPNIKDAIVWMKDMREKEAGR
ncbi:MAG: cobalamin-dependent protein [Methanomassiliicoccales archaeon]|nr:cobalamin-dependent protein [Methanomassiliicoccales archaeon]